MTSDKVTLRVNLIVTYIVTDVVRATQATADYAQALYREAQLVLRAAVGTKTLDALLADKESVGNEVRDALIVRAAEVGVTVKSVGSARHHPAGRHEDAAEPGNRGDEGSRSEPDQASRRTAAARSQVNTAKLLADNPQLQRLKELELLKDVLAARTRRSCWAAVI
jgi:regulator of protease activity HflC (stomatin/prohibitin superfamily)